MKSRPTVFSPDAATELINIWELVEHSSGMARADGLAARIEAFCYSLGSFWNIGTRHDNLRAGLRSVPVPGLRRSLILFQVQPQAIIIVRIGYLGQNVWAGLPTPANDKDCPPYVPTGRHVTDFRVWRALVNGGVPSLRAVSATPSRWRNSLERASG